MTKLIRVSCAIILDSGKVLCAQRSEKMDLPLKWELPGGKIEENESAADCLKREIFEELNIEIQIIRSFESHIHQYSPLKKIELIPFLCSYNNSRITLKEHNDFCWKEIGKLSELDWAEADIPIIRNFVHWFSLNRTQTHSK